MKIAAIIVTYADRSGYVKQVVERLISFDIYRIVIVDNNSAPASNHALKELEATHRRIRLISLDRNTGSAYAYNRGLEYAVSDDNCEYIWLLDDDNMPDGDAYRVLAENMLGEPDRGVNGRVIFSLIRDKRKIYIDAVHCSMPYLIPGRKNIFRSFHVASFFSRRPVPDVMRSIGEVYALPYGGMFFHRKVLEIAGFSDENYFLYCDDFDFCCRFRSSGGRLFLSLESGITDMEKSWNVGECVIKSIATGSCRWRTYYSVRNRVFLEKKYLVNSWPVYVFNMMVYSTVVTLISISRLKFRNLEIYYTALFHGLSGRMGYNGKYGV